MRQPQTLESPSIETIEELTQRKRARVIVVLKKAPEILCDSFDGGWCAKLAKLRDIYVFGETREKAIKNLWAYLYELVVALAVNLGDLRPQLEAQYTFLQEYFQVSLDDDIMNQPEKYAPTVETALRKLGLVQGNGDYSQDRLVWLDNKSWDALTQKPKKRRLRGNIN